MADIAGQVSSFLTLATTWYNNVAARLTAQATLQVRLINFDLYHDHIAGVVTKVFEVNNRLAPQQVELLNQAIWVLHLDESLRQWLSFAGFGSKKSQVTVVRRGRSGQPVYQRKKLTRGRKLPWVGVAGKQVAFETLFKDLQTAFERLETMMCSDAYLNTDRLKIVGSTAPARNPSGPRGGALSDDSDNDDAAFAQARRAREKRATEQEIVAELALRQKVRQDRSLQILSERLEGGISDMLRSMGKEDVLRDRRKNRARADHLRREVVQEQAMSLAEIDEMALRDSELKDELELSRLRKARIHRMKKRFADSGAVDSSEEGSVAKKGPRPPPKAPRGPAPSSRGGVLHVVPEAPPPPPVAPEVHKKGKMKTKAAHEDHVTIEPPPRRAASSKNEPGKGDKAKGKQKAGAATTGSPGPRQEMPSSTSSESSLGWYDRRAAQGGRGFWVRHRDDRLELRVRQPQ